MKLTALLRFALPVAGAIALAGCVVDSGGGTPGVGPITIQPPTPAPAPTPVYSYRWVGTAPFCAAGPTSCLELGPGWEYVNSSTSGGGAKCASGVKVQCRRQTN